MSEITRCTSAAERRQELLDSTLGAVKKCQVRFGGKVELATEGNDEINNLCTRLEMALLHGLKVVTPSLGMAVIKNVKDLVSNNFGSTENGGVWRIVRTILNKHEYERYLMLASVTNDTGRGRAWLRSVLNEQSLERYLHMLLGDEIRLKEFYEEWAFMRDQERSSMLPSMAAGLCSIRFALKVDNIALNGEDSGESTFAASISGFLPTLKPQAPNNKNFNPTIAAEVNSDLIIDTSKVRTKKKKKLRAPAQIVSFDDDSSQRIEGDSFSESAPSTCINSPAQLNPNSHHNEYSHLVTKNNLLLKNKSSPSLLSKSVANEDHFRFSYDPVNLRTADTPDAEEIDFYGSSVNKPEKDSDEQFNSLTPVTNKGIGALFPINTHNNSSLVSDDAGNSGEDSVSNPSVGMEDTDYATQQALQSYSRTFSNEINLDESASISQASVHSFESNRSNSSLKREDLKQALLSVMEKKDELELQGKSLKSLLDQEISHVAEVRQELSDIKQINKEKLEKLEGRNNILSRENELLKHQLKKYVGAVQKLRDGPQAYETLAELDGAKDSENSKYIDYHFEASEYEKKLIQVAEMHGELLEFNENLQRSVQSKESIISRLREELISLRGPFPDEEDRIMDDNTSICSSYADSGSIGTARVLVNIWIPSVFLTGSGSTRHHVYQVYVRIRDTEWNVYRRYSQFFQMHQNLRKKDPIVNSFEFPPKKSMGNKNERFVEDRRKALQAYLRSIVNYLVTTNVSLSCSPDKETLLNLLPFFGDSAAAGAEQQPSLSIFSRRRRSDLPVSHLVL
eukprot:GFUD01020275.1.p1 GENE.GFUD01020275.1~~GFUD01020275.1.p1  ORF type:complete len:796 (+),score=193.24 GFUD01020275.1:230-2617(+)